MPTNLAPPPAPAGAVGPDAPVSKVTESLQAKLASMQSGNGLTADEAARRALLSNVDVTAKQKSLDVANAQRDRDEIALLSEARSAGALHPAIEHSPG